MSGILTIAASHNNHFSRLLGYYNIVPGNLFIGSAGGPNCWGMGNKNHGYYACLHYPDQINLYRLHRCIIGGLSWPEPTYGDISDSTGTLNFPFKYHIDSPWKIPEYTEDDFERCMYLAVQYYLNNYEHCSIMCSGGVDSSGIVAAFIKYGTKDKFTIAHTSQSITEYPLLFDYLIKNKFNMIDLEFSNLGALPGVVLHGSNGESFLPGCVDKFSSHQMLELPWERAINPDEWNEDTESLIEFTRPYLKLFGKTNPTVADLCVFVNIAGRSNNIFNHHHYDQNMKVDKLSSFYRFTEFSKWAYYHGNKHLINSHLPHHYRAPIRDTIFSVLHDQSYINSKLKVNSRHLWKLKCTSDSSLFKADSAHSHFFIDYSGEWISATTEEEYRQKYGNRFDSYFKGPTK